MASYEKIPQAQGEEAGQPMFKSTPSAAELASANVNSYADEGFAEHKASPAKHLDPYWHKGYGGLRPEGEDLSDEEQRLHELEAHKAAGAPGVVQRAKEAVTGAAQAVAEKVGPGQFRTSKSAAEIAMADAEGYASEGYAEHKGSKHLEEHWKKGYGGLRPEGEDLSDEEQRLHELEAHHPEGGVIQTAKETVVGAVQAAGEKASEVLQSAKEMVGLAEPKK